MLSYEGYEEYYNHYVRWAENQGLVPEEKMTHEFFDAQMSRMDSYARQQLAREAQKAGLPIPPNLLVQEDPHDRMAQAKKLDKPMKLPISRLTVQPCVFSVVACHSHSLVKNWFQLRWMSWNFAA